MKNTFNTKSILDTEIDNKIVICRVDYNVPFNPSTGEISDDSRILESLPTINYLLKHNCKILLCSHLGRPNGKVVDELKMERIYDRLQSLLNTNVKFPSPIAGISFPASQASIGQQITYTIINNPPIANCL